MTILSTREQPTQITRHTGPPVRARLDARAGGGGFTGKDFLRVLRKRIWLVLLCLLVFTGLAGVATQLWLVYAPQYTATAYLTVSQPENVLAVGARGMAGSEIDRYKRTLARLAKTDQVLERATNDNPNVKQTRWYRQDQAHILPRLRDAIVVYPIAETDLITVSMTGPDPRELPEIVNAVADEFVRYAGQKEQSSQRANADKLQKQIDQLKAELKGVQGVLVSLRPKEAPQIEQTLKLLSHAVEKQADERFRLEQELRTRQAQKELFEQQRARGDLDNSPVVLEALSKDPMLYSLNNELVVTMSGAEGLRQKFNEGHPVLAQYAIRQAVLQSQILGRETMLRESAFDRKLGELDSEITRFATDLQKIQQGHTESMRRSADLQETLARIQTELHREAQLSDDIRKREEKLLELKLEGDWKPVQLSAPATPPDAPSMPRWSVMIPIGVFLGLVVGVGLALLLEFVDTSIKTPTDVARRVDLPLLGIIPHTDDLEEDIPDLRLAFATNPNSLVGEAFRQVRTSLLFAAPAGQTRSLLVTSPLPGDGRGTVALNLAASIASGGRKVLVVDANFRQSMCRKLFPQCPAEGLSNALVGHTPWGDSIHEIAPNLHLLASGPLPPNPAELLGSDHMRAMLAEMTTRYDQVIFDGPPCLLVSDAPILSTLVDGVLLVVRAGVNTHGVVGRARDSLQRIGAHVLGVVLNGIRVTAGGYLRDNYRTFYEYHEQDQIEAK